MENTGVHTFELIDARGASHSYTVTEHAAGEGMEIMYALLGLGAPAVLSLAGAALKSEDMVRAIMGALGGGDGESATDLSSFTAMLADLDFAKVGSEVSLALGSGRAPLLTRQILKNTYRDTRRLTEAGIDLAYQANYMELLTATWKVCQINGFFPLPSTLRTSLSGQNPTSQ